MTDEEYEARISILNILCKTHGIQRLAIDTEDGIATYFKEGWLNDDDLYKAITTAIRLAKKQSEKKGYRRGYRRGRNNRLY